MSAKTDLNQALKMTFDNFYESVTTDYFTIHAEREKAKILFKIGFKDQFLSIVSLQNPNNVYINKELTEQIRDLGIFQRRSSDELSKFYEAQKAKKRFKECALAAIKSGLSPTEIIASLEEKQTVMQKIFKEFLENKVKEWHRNYEYRKYI